MTEASEMIINAAKADLEKTVRERGLLDDGIEWDEEDFYTEVRNYLLSRYARSQSRITLPLPDGSTRIVEWGDWTDGDFYTSWEYQNFEETFGPFRGNCLRWEGDGV